ncbi:hypothetical protein [Balneatrix alpica]|nr:hypothetical protein [Balneatrix alpica]
MPVLHALAECHGQLHWLSQCSASGDLAWASRGFLAKGLAG